VESRRERGLPEAAAKLRSLVAGTSREERSQILAVAFDKLGPEDRFYCTMAYLLITKGMVRDLVRDRLFPIDIAYDPKLRHPYDQVLEFAINSGMTELSGDLVADPLGAILGDASVPWRVRPASREDREGVAFADWLVYPLAVAFRVGVRPGRRAVYAKICGLIDKFRVSVHPLPNPP
jgi:hypothetical protein